jgi:hypothetical protein
MSEDQNLKRLFAQAPVVDGDEDFVARLAADVAQRRKAHRARRVVLVTLFCLIAVVLAILLAPLAPSVWDLGNSLVGLPDQVGAAAEATRNQPGAWYLGIALAGIALPLAGITWLLRRA